MTEPKKTDPIEEIAEVTRLIRETEARITHLIANNAHRDIIREEVEWKIILEHRRQRIYEARMEGTGHAKSL